jgi:hypothetical protein
VYAIGSARGITITGAAVTPSSNHVVAAGDLPEGAHRLPTEGEEVHTLAVAGGLGARRARSSSSDDQFVVERCGSKRRVIRRRRMTDSSEPMRRRLVLSACPA